MSNSTSSPASLSEHSPIRVRHHALDALRASALLLGVLFHAGLSYLPGPGTGWAIQDRSTHVLIAIGVLIIHSFRLEVFFLLAGFFGRLVHSSRGLKAYVTNRFLRLLVPFVLGWLLVYPGLAFSWIWGAMKGDPKLFWIALRLGYAETWKQIQRVADGSVVDGFPLSHLWFLYSLLILCLAFLLLRALLGASLRSIPGWKDRVDRVLGALMNSGWILPVLTLISTVFLLRMKTWGVDTPDKSFKLDFPVMLLYGLTFSVGWLLHRQLSLLGVLRRRAWLHVICAVLFCLPALALAQFEGQRNHAYWGTLRLLHHAFYAGMMWSLVLASLGLFLRFFDRDSPTWRYLSDSSYWVYIIHLPIVTAMQVSLSRMDLSCWTKLLISTLVPLVFCYLSYHLLVRSTYVGQLLNGRRHPFHLLPR